MPRTLQINTNLASLIGLEPTTCSLGDYRSIRLSYREKLGVPEESVTFLH